MKVGDTFKDFFGTTVMTVTKLEEVEPFSDPWTCRMCGMEHPLARCKVEFCHSVFRNVDELAIGLAIGDRDVIWWPDRLHVTCPLCGFGENIVTKEGQDDGS